MTDRIEPVIAEATARHRVERCSVSSRDRHEQWWQCIACDFESEHIPLAGVMWEQVQSEVQAFHGAEVALAALKAARIAVVELPEQCVVPSHWSDDCLGAWEAINYGADPVSAWPGKRRGVALPDATFVSVDAARDLAAALLAAADAAEASQ